MKTYILLLFCSISMLFSASINAQSITLQTIETGLNSPVDIKNAGDSRIFVVEQGGTIKIVDPTGSNPSTTFLDISNLTNGGGERGLLSVAFHPNYSTNGQFYVNYTNLNGNTVIAQYDVSSTNPDVADPNGTILLSYTQPFGNHNGGCIQFGPDGFLYISSGDGGSGGDPGDRAQDNSTLLGKLLRIDVDNTTGSLPYGIPASNPFANSAGADEIYSTGLRNAWKFSFDRTNGDIWSGDVGQGDIEEINQVPFTANNINYGWRCYEGSDSFDTTGNCPPDAQLTFPVAEYNHTGNGPFKCSITGGYVYRGNLYPNFQGLYFFADFCSDEIGVVEENSGTYTQTFITDLSGEGLSSFGEDMNGELYVCGLSSGNLYRINDATASLEDQNTVLARISPNPSSGFINVQLFNEQAQELVIYDLFGKQIKAQTLSSTDSTVDISSLKSGMYLAQIRNGNQNQTIKLYRK